MMKKIKVLIVDDSALVRNTLEHGLSMDNELEVVGKAGNPYEARDLIVKLKPEVLTLDIEMPKMDGLEFLKKLMPQYPLPVIMVSALTERGSQITLTALQYGAVDFVTKPSANVKSGLSDLMKEIRAKIKIASKVDVKNLQTTKVSSEPVKINALAKTTDKVIAIGASTGGTEAIREIVKALPPNTPGIVAVQHMPPGFTKMFAKGLDEVSQLSVKEAKSGDRVLMGQVLIAPGSHHLQIIRSGGEYRVVCRDGDIVCGHKPSVDVLFRSVAKYAGANSIGVMLTGMGKDGAEAMVKLKDAGGRTIAQDEASCVVFGMPKEAYDRGGAESLVPLNSIPQKIIDYLESMD
jgi:two-component system chemotaxis response regulator CheB